MDTKSVNGKMHVEQMSGEKCNDFKNGDQTTTLISTENGKVIEIIHNVMTPQPYNRMYQLTGTKGFANKYPIEGFALSSKELSKAGVTPSADDLSGHSYLPQKDADALVQKYESPIVAKYEKEAKEVGGHGGMDFIMDSRLVYCLQNGLPLDIDVYDLHIDRPLTMEDEINRITGVLENGIFARNAADVLILGTEQGVKVIKPGQN